MDLVFTSTLEKYYAEQKLRGIETLRSISLQDWLDTVAVKRHMRSSQPRPFGWDVIVGHPTISLLTPSSLAKATKNMNVPP